MTCIVERLGESVTLSSQQKNTHQSLSGMKRADNDLTKPNFKPAFFKQYAPYVLTDSNLLSDFDKLSIYADIYNEL